LIQKSGDVFVSPGSRVWKDVSNMNRKERRAAAHKNLKLDRKAGFPAKSVPETLAAAAPPAPSPKPPISDAKLNANRANAQHSTGAVTNAGRAASSQNHTVHGLARHNGAFRVLPSEDAVGFEALKAGLVAEYLPATPTESILVNTMVESHWLSNRAQRLADLCCHTELGLIEHPQPFNLYLRYQTTHTRAFHKALNDLLKLRAERRKADLGFEAQKRQTEELRLKTEKQEMKKQEHYWDVLRKDAEACHQLAANTTQQINASKENPGFEAQYAAESAKRGIQPNLGRSATAA
jgi:hypothetical protein